ncbi:MAG: peptide chain release factor N(5)-glutamine methyltransferase [Candidatus Zixiibacteriota bacterium]
MAESIAGFITEKGRLLESAGIDQGLAEVELILCHLLNVSRLDLVLHGMERLTPEVRTKFDHIIERRLTRYPLQFILEETWFYGRRFKVTPAVMAPTPETELLCEAAVKFIHAKRITAARILDIGVGSGVISLTVASEVPDATLVSVDVSGEAIAVARENASALEVADRVEFRQSDMFSAIKGEERFDLILSNPPYIAEPDYAGLEPEVLADPKIAMTSGAEGLDAIRIILKRAPAFLTPGGRIMFEIGYRQADKIAALTAEDKRYSSISILRDLNDIDRVIILGCV